MKINNSALGGTVLIYKHLPQTCENRSGSSVAGFRDTGWINTNIIAPSKCKGFHSIEERAFNLKSEDRVLNLCITSTCCVTKQDTPSLPRFPQLQNWSSLTMENPVVMKWFCCTDGHHHRPWAPQHPNWSFYFYSYPCNPLSTLKPAFLYKLYLSLFCLTCT